MAGRKLVLAQAFTDTSLPKLRDDPLLTPGSLALIEFAHPASPFAGVPANNATIPNIAHVEGAATLALTDTGYPAVVNASGGYNNGVKGKLERSVKGGLHGIVSQSPGVASLDGVKVTLAAEIRAFIYANKAGHTFYFSRWSRLTRIALIPGNFGGCSFDVANGANTNMAVRITGPGPWEQSSANPPGNSRATVANTLGPCCDTVSPTAALVTLASAPATAGHVWGMPASSFNNAVPGWATRLPSFIAYRMYVEDLTVSGRTWAQVDALDFAEYTKQVLTAGGRYFGDVFTTDPATIP